MIDGETKSAITLKRKTVGLENVQLNQSWRFYVERPLKFAA